MRAPCWILAALSFTALPLDAAKHVVVVTHTAGFRHDSIPTAERVLGELATRSGLFTVSYCRTADDVRRMLAPAALVDVDAVVFANTTGDLGLPDLDGFLAWVRSGRAFAGVHSAADTYHPSATVGTAFVDMLGAEFERHGTIATASALVENRSNPSVAHFADRFTITDELYEFVRNPRPRAHVVLSLDRHPDDGHPEAGQPADLPLAWYSRYGDGAVFYTALGHRSEVWDDADFQRHLLGALRWLLAVTDRSSVTIPAAASRAGANGTFFRTDLWLHNGSGTSGVDVTVRLRCALASACGSGPRTFTLAPRATRLLPDVVGDALGAPGGSGALEITWPRDGGPVTAFSRVSTALAAGGTSGAAVVAIPRAARTRSLFIGLRANGPDRSSGFRSNAGVSNPTPNDVEVGFELFDANGVRLGARRVVSVAGAATLQLDDVFAAVGAPTTVTNAASLVVSAEVPVDPYVTVIDNVSGDAVSLSVANDELR